MILLKMVKYLINHSLVVLLSASFLTLYYFSTRGLPARSMVFSRVIMLLLAGVILWNLLDSLYGWREKSTQKDQSLTLWVKNLGSGGVIFLITLTYVIMIPILGFTVSFFLYVFGVLYYLKIRNLVFLILYSVIMYLFVYLIFIYLLGINFPSGMLF